MKIIEVNNTNTVKQFLLVNKIVNQHAENYIQPLDMDIKSVFDEEKNPAYKFGETMRWVLQDDAGKLIGRIAAFTHKKYINKGDRMPVGGIGFFDCINDQQAANLLFDTAKQWLAGKGKQAMDGPINFGERDKWWGLVIDGFQPPLYCMNYNQPYYQTLFENYGFQIFYNQFCFGLNIKAQLNPKIIARYDKLIAEGGYKTIPMDKNNLEKFIDDFLFVYNNAWAQHQSGKEMKRKQVENMFNQIKPIMDPNVIWFTYHNDKPIGFYINLPDLNFWFKHLHGKFDFWHKLKFLWLKKTKPNQRLTGIIFGILPDYQLKGIDSFMIRQAYIDFHSTAKSYQEYEMQWVGDFNPKMINIIRSFGETFVTRKLAVFRCNFDPNVEFKRHPLV